MNTALISEVRALLVDAYAFSGMDAPSFSDQEISGALASIGSTSTAGLDVPDFRQSAGYDCGAAATHTVARAFGVGADTEEEFIAALGTNPQDGTRPSHIIELLQRLGLAVSPAAGMTVEDLADVTGFGDLVICPIQAWGTPREYRAELSGHYVVVTGVDKAGVCVQDPSAGPRVIPFQEWQAVWRDRDADGLEYTRYGIQVGKAPAMSFAEKDIALGGHDGRQAEQLLHSAVKQGATTLRQLTRRALLRLLQQGAQAVLEAKTLFDKPETDALAEQLAMTTASGQLLGMHRIRKHEEKVIGVPGNRLNRATPQFQAFTFDETNPTLEPMTPTRALEYFRKLSPKISADPAAFVSGVERTSFALAVTVDETVLTKIQNVITNALETGESRATVGDIDTILEEAGIHDRPEGYSEAVWRTEAMQAYNAGAMAELSEVTETFPVFRYSNPCDGRSRPSHCEKDGKYYPSTVPFEEVRGTDASDVINCRCTFIAIDIKEWQELQAAGATVETDW